MVGCVYYRYWVFMVDNVISGVGMNEERREKTNC